mmetsp:Transcript_34406/g.69502  ORF Transcript_34406/g.69502 Transcript_34406/m.69502 type:complete len:152 (-) Transcript_34406:99-554(-)
MAKSALSSKNVQAWLGGPPLQPVAAPRIEDNLVLWARAQRRSQKGRQVQWTRWTEKELLRLEAVARSQVSKLIPLLDSVSVRERLVREGLLPRDGPSDVLLDEAQDLSKAVLVQLLNARAAWILGEDAGADQDVRKEEEFENFLESSEGVT